MSWFNYYGLIIMTIIMVPNIVYAVKHKNESSDYHNKTVKTLEQVGRYGCFVLMIFNVPYLYLNFWFEHALIVYLSENGALCLAYLVFWGVYWGKKGLLKALSLSILPSCIFIFSGVLLAHFPLLVFSVIFAASHIFISYKTI